MKTPQKIGLAAVALAFLGLAWYLGHQSAASSAKASAVAPAGSVIALASAPATSASGQQVFEILAKEGYQPPEISAKAGQPLILKFKTDNSFDCSTTVSLPQFNFRTHLQPSGELAIEIPAQKAGDSVYGVCGMGMYHFVIKFS